MDTRSSVVLCLVGAEFKTRLVRVLNFKKNSTNCLGNRVPINRSISLFAIM